MELLDQDIVENAITIAGDGSYPLTAFFHPYKFGAKDNVTICVPQREMPASALFYILSVINSETWRFSYGRKCYVTKIKKLKFPLPVNDRNEIDYEFMKQIVESSSNYWQDLKNFIIE